MRNAQRRIRKFSSFGNKKKQLQYANLVKIDVIYKSTTPDSIIIAISLTNCSIFLAFSSVNTVGEDL